jgi:hypothetical protein
VNSVYMNGNSASIFNASVQDGTHFQAVMINGVDCSRAKPYVDENEDRFRTKACTGGMRLFGPR